MGDTNNNDKPQSQSLDDNAASKLAQEHAMAYQAKYLQTCVMSRHSIRVYEETDVPLDLIHDCVELAQHAPSNSNIQNWRLHLARGAARDRICKALYSVATEKGPNIGGIPDEFMHFRREMGANLYGKDGYDIARDDREARQEATMRNYDFFGAPVVGVITMSEKLGWVDAMSVGMFVQTLLLALTERGLGSCLQQSVVGHPEVLRREFGIPDDEMLLAGIAIGYPAEHRVNALVIPRSEVEKNVRVLHE